MIKVHILKISLSFLAFTAALTIGAQSLASEGGGSHKAQLFPQPEANKEKSTAPKAPGLTEPAFMAKISGGTVTLKWNASEGADFYNLQVATDPNFKWLVTSEVMYKGTSFEAKGLESNKHYYWRVFAGKSTNDAGNTKSPAAKSMFETL